MSCVHPAGWLANRLSNLLASLASIFNIGHYKQAFFIQIFHTCHDYRYHSLLPFCSIFTDLDLAWGLQGQHKAKTFGLIFSHTSELIRMKLVLLLKQFQLNSLVPCMHEI